MEDDYLKYCSLCAGKLEKQSENLYICSNCQFHHYINPKSCNALILSNEKDEILLVKRKFEPGKGDWDLPGGFIDLNETAEEGMIREAIEEINLQLEEAQLTYLGSFPDRYKFMGQNYHTLSIVFTSKITNPNLTAADDAEELKFFPLDEVPENLAFPSIIRAIKKYKLVNQ